MNDLLSSRIILRSIFFVLILMVNIFGRPTVWFSSNWTCARKITFDTTDVRSGFGLRTNELGIAYLDISSWTAKPQTDFDDIRIVADDGTELISQISDGVADTSVKVIFLLNVSIAKMYTRNHGVLLPMPFSAVLITEFGSYGIESGSM